MTTKRLLAFALLLISFAFQEPARAETKIGTVDINRVLQEYSETKEAEAKINEAKNAAKKEYDERAEAYKKELDEINQLNAQVDAPALSAEAKRQKAKDRDEKIAKIKTTEREINDFRQTREQQLQQQVLRLRESLLKDITAVVLEQVKTSGFDLVFDKSGPSTNGFSPILFSRERDFTAEVIASLNKKAPPPSSASAEISPSPRPK